MDRELFTNRHRMKMLILRAEPEPAMGALTKTGAAERRKSSMSRIAAAANTVHILDSSLSISASSILRSSVTMFVDGRAVRLEVVGA